MRKVTFILFLLWLTCMTSLSVSAQQSKTKVPTNREYKAGQKWSYKTRPGEEDSFLIILKVETDPKLGTIVHIALNGLKMKNRRSPDGFSESAHHLPFAKEAIDKSVLKQLKENTDLPDFEDGYQMWREAFNANRAGIYTITVAEAVRIMEATLNQ